MRSTFISTAVCACVAILVGACSREAKFQNQLDAGCEALAAGHYPDAIDHLNKAVRLSPDSATAYCNLGIAYAAVKQTDDAMFTLLMAKDLLKQDPRPAILLADVYCQADRCDEARKTLASLNEEVPGQPNILTHMAVVEFRQGEMDAARTLLDSALDVRADYAPALYNIAVLKRDHDVDEIGALRYFARYLSVVGDGPYTERAREASALLRRIPPANTPPREPASPAPRRTVSEAASSPAPDPDSSLLDRATEAIAEKDFESALVLLKEATGRDRGDAEALWQLAGLYRDHLDQADRSVATFRSFAESFPADPRSIKARAAAGMKPPPTPVPVSSMSRSERREKLRNIWQEALSEHRKKNWGQAALLYKQVLKLDARLGIASYNLGLVYKAMGDFDAARQAFAKAAERSPAMFKARYMQAVVERELGETDKAIASAHEVVRDESSHDKAHLLLGLLYREKEAFAKAYEHFVLAAELAPDATARAQAQAWVKSTAERLP